MLRIVIFLICVAVVSAIALLLLGPRLAADRMERLDRKMMYLRERVKTNASDAEALDALMRAARSRNSFERTLAITYLGQLGSRGEPAIGLLIEALNGGDPYDARQAAQSLGEIGPSAKRAVPDLMRAMQQHLHSDIGCFSAESLGNIADPDDTRVQAALHAALMSVDPQMRVFSKRGLDRLSQRGGRQGHTDN